MGGPVNDNVSAAQRQTAAWVVRRLDRLQHSIQILPVPGPVRPQQSQPGGGVTLPGRYRGRVGERGGGQ